VRAVVGTDLDPGDEGEIDPLTPGLDNATYLVVVGDRKPDTLLCRKSQRILHTGGGVGSSRCGSGGLPGDTRDAGSPGAGVFPEYDVPVVSMGGLSDQR